MKLQIPTIDLHSDVGDIAAVISTARLGALWVKNLPQVPFEKIGKILSHLASNDGRQLGNRLNKAYTNNLVFKDAWALGKGGPSVDRKRVLDLSPERLAVIAETDLEVLDIAEKNTELLQVLDFWQDTADSSEKLLKALAVAIGSNDILDDVAFNFRMVDYFSHNDGELEAPRCGEHRDFGSFTLIHTTQTGLEIQDESGNWQDIGQNPGESTALMLFGWCTQIRSNGRIPAVLHRVVDHREDTISSVAVPRRLSAILFCAPKKPDTVLEPVVGQNEIRRYIGGVRVGQLRGSMARKWRHGEGTEDEEDRIYEEEEIRVSNMKTQDDVVKNLIAI